jgi:acyl-homoserine-lactone acylase
VNISEAGEVLAAWDLRADLDSPGAILRFEFWDRFSQVPVNERYKVQFDPADPIGTPRDGNDGSPRLLESLADAVHDTRDEVVHFGSRGSIGRGDGYSLTVVRGEG